MLANHLQDKALKAFEDSHKEFSMSELSRGRAGVWGRAVAVGDGSWQEEIFWYTELLDYIGFDLEIG